MRILIVSHYAPPHHGGIEYVAREQALCFTALGHEVTWIASQLPAGSTADERWEGGQLIRYPALNFLEPFGIPYPLFGPGFGRRMREAVTAADVVHVHGMLYQGTSQALRWARQLGKPAVMTCHVLDRSRAAETTAAAGLGARLRRRALTAMEQTAHRCIGQPNLRTCARVIVLNRAVQAYVEQTLGDSSLVHLIPNGVDLKRFAPVDGADKARLRAAMGLPLDRPLAGFVGRITPRKGAHLVLEALREPWHLLLVGRGELPPQAARSRATITHLPSVDRERMAEILAVLDLLILPSVGEGFPLVVQEAMAMGVPVILTDDPAYEGIVPRNALYLTPPTTQGIEQALADFTAYPERAVEIGRRGQQFATDQFSWDTNARRCLNLFQDVIDSHPRSKAPYRGGK